MIRELVGATDPILQEVMPEFDFKDQTLSAIEIAKDLAETMISHKGLGLAAPQIGLRVRAFAITGTPISVFFNPRLVSWTNEEVELEEGCLTYPNVFLKITRPRTIKIRFTMPNGEVDTKTYTDLTARIIQHEYDHIEGITFNRHVSKLKWDMAKRKAKKIG